MKLKPILQNTVVHTPTEAEAKELLAILHEGGYEWYHKYAPIPNPNLSQVKYIHIYQSLHGCKNVITYCEKSPFEKFFTLAGFKEMFVLNEDNFAKSESESEKSQSQFQVGDKVIVVTTDYNLKDVVGGIGVITKIMPHGYHIKSSTGEWFVKDEDIMPYSVFTKENPKPKFKPGDKVKVLYSPDHQGKISVIESVIRSTSDISPYCYALSGVLGTFFEKCLESYTEPEAKEAKDEAKELNFCELLTGQEGEIFYSPYIGECRLDEITHNSDHPIGLRNDDDVWVALPSCGHEPDGVVMLFPSWTLYEQYPLDAAKAWSVWQSEQKKIALDVNFRTYDAPDFGEVLYFRSSADRDKCLKEIQVIIDKYRKKVEK